MPAYIEELLTRGGLVHPARPVGGGAPVASGGLTGGVVTYYRHVALVKRGFKGSPPFRRLLEAETAL
jgi:hypothetical protein